MRIKTIALCASLVFFISTLLYSQTAQQPNVVIVITDDQGYPELSYHGNPVLKTPYTDKLAEQSIRFADFHVAPMCAPTRGQLLTGLDAARNGTINVSSGRELLNPELPTMADFFRENGYRTGIFGKWHLGPNYPFRPEDRGFDETVWFPSSHIGAVSDYWGNDYFDDTYVKNGKRTAFKGYCTDVFFDQALSFMKNSAQASKPFFSYISTNTPHWPFNIGQEDIRAIEEAFAESSLTDMEPALKSRLINYLAMIRNIDTNMGKLLDFLKKNDLEENTIVIFLTDNGSIFGPRYYNAGMRGEKTELWEGGHRVPCFIRWPEGNLGKPREIDGLTQAQDILPTLIEFCGLTSTRPLKFDGISLAPIMRGVAKVPENRMLVINYSRMPSGFNYPSPYGQSLVKKDGAAVLWKRWRLLENRELYDLEMDPLQQLNVIDKFPEVVAKMRKHLDSWWDGVKDFVNIPKRIIVGNDIENPLTLTACDWLDVFVDQQAQIRRGVRKTGYWLLDIAEAGEYEFELRRWPKEINVPLVASVPEEVHPAGRPIGKALPITTAQIYVDGIHHLDIAEKRPYGFEGLRQEISPGDTAAKFTVNLPAGPTTLHTWFNDENRDVICSAYYVYVKRL